jgi:hypothetical protein
LFQRFAIGVVNTSGKFTTGVIDTGGNLPPVSLTLVANLPPVSTTPAVPVVHLDKQISLFSFYSLYSSKKSIIPPFYYSTHTSIYYCVPE